MSSIKQLQVNLGFTADTNAAMANLQKLKMSLSEISSLPFTMGKNINSDLKLAAQSATELQHHLGQAMNVQTGNLNLNKFNASLKASGQSLSALTSNLLKAGITGEKAFLATHSAIAQANLQLKKSNTLVSSFMNTFTNTVKWQLASTLIHQVTSGLSSALNYAKDLNTSLNNIQIVTGQSAEQMAEFARQANKAAKELKTTTVAYSDAALIYYQQGLKGEAVKERADTTVKLANVTRESAETVSQWMTAVWNNFDDGSKSLEYYADVMTALGAATASSSDEIAQGLEKFAAVSETVGLSYEYATTALATITATTRQSADVVGTALKTLFARIQGLNLGETLEDGTTLNKYSEALASVGISIKDSAGGLKEMDTILNEMGAKWDTISKGQQVALAQNVAGIRQYTQLIALMDNWDYFQQNLGVAKNAEGTLEEQQKTYEESWQAASKNIQASMEDLWSTLIPTDTIIDMTNGLAKIVDGFTDMIDAAGGLKTIMLFIANTVLSKFQSNIAMAFDTGISKVTSLGQGIKKFANDLDVTKLNKTTLLNTLDKTIVSEEQQRKNMMNNRSLEQQAIKDSLDNALIQKTSDGNKLPLSEGFLAEIQNLKQVEAYNTQILNLKNKMTSAEFQSLQNSNEMLNSLGKENALLKQKSSDLKEQLEIIKDQQAYSFNVKDNFRKDTEDGTFKPRNQNTIADSSKEIKKAFKITGEDIQTKVGGKEAMEITAIRGYVKSFKDKQSIGMAQQESLDIINNIVRVAETLNGYAQNQNMLEAEKFEMAKKNLAVQETNKQITKNEYDYLIKNAHTSQDLVNNAKNLVIAGKKYSEHLGVSKDNIANMEKNARDLYKTEQKNSEVTGRMEATSAQIAKNIQQIIKRGASLGNIFVKGLQGASQMAMGLSMVTSAFQSLNQMVEENEITFSGVLGVITSLGMGLPILINGFRALTSAVATDNLQQTISLALLKRKGQLTVTYQKINEGSIATETIQNALVKSGIATKEAEIIVQGMANKTNKVGYLMSILKTKAKAGETTATWNQVLANIAETNSMMGKLAVTLLVVAALAALVAIVVVVTNVVMSLAKAYNADAIAAESAKKSAENLAAVYSDVKDKYEELKSSLNDYQESQNAINKLKSGTLEWKQAIQEANAQVVDLLAKYPELVQYYKLLDGGRMIIQEAGWDYLLAQQAEQVTRAANLSALSQANSRIAQNKADITAFKRENYLILNGTVKNPEGLNKAIHFDKFIDTLSESYAKIGEQAFINEKGVDLLAKTLKNLGIAEQETIEETKELIRQQNLYKQSLLTQYANIAHSMISEKTNYNENIYTSGLQKLIDIYSQEFTKKANGIIDTEAIGITNRLSDFAYAEGAWTRGTDYGISEFKKWAEDLGIKLNEEKIDFTPTGVEYKSVDSSNQQNEGYVSYEDLASHIMEREFEKIVNNAIPNIERLSNLGKQYQQSEDLNQQVVGAILKTGDLSSLTAEQVEELKNATFTFENVDKAAINALSTLGYSADSIQIAIEQIDIKELEAQQLKEINDRAMATIEAGSAELEIDAEVLEVYTDKLIENNSALEKQKDLAAETAVNHFRLQKSLEKLKTAYEDNQEALESAEASPIEYAEGLSQVKTALEELYGLDISTNFVEENLPTIKELLENGNENAYRELQKKAIEDFVSTLEIKPEEQNAFLKQIEKLKEQAQQSNTIEYDLKVNDKEFISSINDMLQKGIMTEEKLESVFRNANLTWGEGTTISYYDLPQSTTTTSHITGNVPGMGELDLEMNATNTSTTRLPWLGDNPPQFKVFNGQSDIDEFIANNSTKKDNDVAFTDESGKEITYGQVRNKEIEWGKSYQYQGTGTTDNESGVMIRTYNDMIGDNLISSLETKAKQREEQEFLRELKEERELNYSITKTIEKLENSLDLLSEAKERAYGKNYLDYIKKEISLQDKLNEKNKQYLNDLQNQIPDIYKTLATTLPAGTQLNIKDDIITNYGEIVDNYIKKIQSSSGATRENYQKDLELFKSAAENYSNHIDLINEVKSSIQQGQWNKEDLQLEEIEQDITFNIEMNEDDIAYYDFLLKNLENDAFATAESIGYIGETTVRTIEQIAATQDGIARVEELIKAQGYITSDQVEYLRDARDNLIDYNETLNKNRELVYEKLTDAYDAWNEKLQENTDIIEHQGTIIDNYKNIIDIIGEDNLGISNETMKVIRESQINNVNDALKSSKAILDANKESLNQMKAAKEQATDPEDITKWDEQIKQAQEKVYEAEQEFMDNWKTALEVAAESFADSIEQITKTFEKSISGIYKNLNELQASFDRQKESSSRYLDDYEKTYEINKLNRQITQSINKSNDIKAQKELADLQKQLLNMNKAGVEISQRDIEYMQKKYDLMLAEQAFKDAQNAKSVVKLKRDSAGNYGYVYTADQSNIDNTQQDYEDKLYALQKFGDESLMEIQEQIIATNQEFSEALQQIAEDANLSTEEKKAKQEEITQYYTEKLRYWTEEANKFMLYGQEMNEQYNANMATDFNETIMGKMYPDLISFKDVYTTGMGAMKTASEEFVIAVEEYEVRYSAAMAKAGTSSDNFENTVTTELGKAQIASSNTANSIEQMAKDMNNALNGDSVTSAISAVKKFQSDYSTQMENIRKQTTDTITEIGKLIKKYQALSSYKEDQNNFNTNNIANDNTFGSSLIQGAMAAGKNSIKNSNSNLAQNSKLTISKISTDLDGYSVVQLSDKNWYYTRSIGYNNLKVGEKAIVRPEVKPIAIANVKFKVGDSAAASGETYTMNTGKVYNKNTKKLEWPKDAKLKANNSKAVVARVPGNITDYFKQDGKEYFKISSHWFEKKDLSFDTGGYTGSWGPEGRIAMLHQKEIVLNAHDTENLLTVVGIVRSMVDQLEANTKLASYGLGQLTARTIGASNDTLQQEVTIHAEFPNATDHNEIEEAFRNLTNLASQYVSRR